MRGGEQNFGSVSREAPIGAGGARRTDWKAQLRLVQKQEAVPHDSFSGQHGGPFPSACAAGHASKRPGR